jgi:hypothetical protein
VSARSETLRKVGIGAGATLLVGIMVLAAFSLGVFVGHQGLLTGTVGNFGARPAVDQPVAPQAPASGPAQNLPMGRAALVGAVGGMTNEGLFVRTLQGPRLVEVNEETAVRDRQGRELSLSDLKPGAQVSIFGEFSEDGRTLTANTIVVVPVAQP